MNTFGLALALATLLVVPGPTNALLMAIGATAHGAALVRALGAVVAGYAASVLALGLIIGPFTVEYPVIAHVLRLMAGVYLLHAALLMWRNAGHARPAAPSGRALFVTTLLNPKGIIIALTLFPAGWHESLAQAAVPLGLLLVLVAASSTLWLGLGAVLRVSMASFNRQGTCCRFSALVLASFGVSLIALTLSR